MKKKKNLNEGYLYRVRKNDVGDYCYSPYNAIEDISSSASVVGKFLCENFVFTMQKSVRFSKETWNKEMVILKSRDNVLEIEKPIYDRYKDDIDYVLACNMNYAAQKYLSNGKTRIVVTYNLSGCDYDIKDERTALGDSSTIKGLNTLYISYANDYDIALFKNIIVSLIGEDKASYKFLNSNDILFEAGQRSLILDKSAYNLLNDVIKEHEKNIKEKGSVKVKQMKLED